MHPSLDVAPRKLLVDLAALLSSSTPSRVQLTKIRRQLRLCGSAGSAETVIESYYRCIINEYLIVAGG
jgi:hypothetical protein